MSAAPIGDGSATVITNPGLLLSMFAAAEQHIHQGGTVVVILRPVGGDV